MTAKEIREKILNGPEQWALRAIVAIYQKQTADEQSAEMTKHHNGVGFCARDGEFGTSIAKQVLAGRRLSDKQLAITRKIAARYAGQLEKIACGK